MRYLLLMAAVLAAYGCSRKAGTAGAKTDEGIHRIFGRAVGDTFVLRVSLPPSYDESRSAEYPLVYLLDSDLYFDMVSSSFHRYAQVGWLPEVIVAGIGYGDFETMDSLRSRDYSFPVAIPEYEMSASGGAKQFLEFINTQVTPLLDSSYRVNAAKRVLMGHSLGGYFALYALTQNNAPGGQEFCGYVAASPSTDYNNDYILEAMKSHRGTSGRKSVYVCFGGNEDEEDGGEVGISRSRQDVIRTLGKALAREKFRGEMYSSFNHMETAVPGFMKGLSWVLGVQRLD